MGDFHCVSRVCNQLVIVFKHSNTSIGNWVIGYNNSFLCSDSTFFICWHFWQWVIAVGYRWPREKLCRRAFLASSCCFSYDLEMVTNRNITRPKRIQEMNIQLRTVPPVSAMKHIPSHNILRFSDDSVKRYHNSRAVTSAILVETVWQNGPSNSIAAAFKLKPGSRVQCTAFFVS